PALRGPFLFKRPPILHPSITIIKRIRKPLTTSRGLAAGVAFAACPAADESKLAALAARIAFVALQPCEPDALLQADAGPMAVAIGAAILVAVAAVLGQRAKMSGTRGRKLPRGRWRVD